MTNRSAHATEPSIILEGLKNIPKMSRAVQRTYTVLVHIKRHRGYIARNRGHFASVINCQRHLFFKMADKNNRSQGKRFPYDILNNLSSLDLFYEVYIP